MGMHFGLVAVKADVAQLVEAFSIAWPRHELKTRGDVAGVGALGAWMSAHARFVSAAKWTPDNPAIDTYGFWQDGDWAILLDPDFVRAADSTGLAVLGERFGRALSFVIETAGATAMFWQFDGGRVSRHVSFQSGEMHAEGDRLPQEDGLPSDCFYMNEMESLQRAFGITPVDALSGDHPVQGVAYVDRTDYAALREARRQRAATAAGQGGEPT